MKKKTTAGVMALLFVASIVGAAALSSPQSVNFYTVYPQRGTSTPVNETVNNTLAGEVYWGFTGNYCQGKGGNLPVWVNVQFPTGLPAFTNWYYAPMNGTCWVMLDTYNESQAIKINEYRAELRDASNNVIASKNLGCPSVDGAYWTNGGTFCFDLFNPRPSVTTDYTGARMVFVSKDTGNDTYKSEPMTLGITVTPTNRMSEQQCNSDAYSGKVLYDYCYQYSLPKSRVAAGKAVWVFAPDYGYEPAYTTLQCNAIYRALGAYPYSACKANYPQPNWLTMKWYFKNSNPYYACVNVCKSTHSVPFDNCQQSVSYLKTYLASGKCSWVY